jgi:hypothetical protein
MRAWPFSILLAAAALLASCASPLASHETPAQALATAAQRTSQLHSVKFDLSASTNASLPPALAASAQGAGMMLGSLSASTHGTGEASFPDRFHLSLTVSFGSVSVNFEMVSIQGKVYLKNPLSGQWTSLECSGLPLESGALATNPLASTELLKDVKSIKDLGDTSLNGTAVHHYQVTPDTEKFLARLSSLPALKDQAAQQALRQLLASGQTTVEVWFGKDDHLVRRVVSNATYNLDLNQLAANPVRASPAPATGTCQAGSSGSPGLLPGLTPPPGFSPPSGLPVAPSFPPGSVVHATARLVVNYHDFNTAVTITPPIP